MWWWYAKPGAFIIDYIWFSDDVSTGTLTTGTLNSSYFKSGYAQHYQSKDLNILVVDATFKTAINSSQTFSENGVSLVSFDCELPDHNAVPMIHWVATVSATEFSISGSYTTETRSGYTVEYESKNVSSPPTIKNPLMTITVSQPPQAHAVSLKNNNVVLTQPIEIAVDEHIRIQYVWMNSTTN